MLCFTQNVIPLARGPRKNFTRLDVPTIYQKNWGEKVVYHCIISPFKRINRLLINTSFLHSGQESSRVSLVVWAAKR